MAIPWTLILDLDETSIHFWDELTFLDNIPIYQDPALLKKFYPPGQPPIAHSMMIDNVRLWGLVRPHLPEFLNFACRYFQNVVIWSAGTKPYVEEISRLLFQEAGLPAPKLIWSREHCQRHTDFYHKPISRILTDLSERPSCLLIDPRRTLIVDDKNHTFLENPTNGIKIPVYRPKPNLESMLDRSDRALLKLKQWLERPEVRNCSDVRLLDKTRIFQPDN